jgi:hypothetical protein
MHVSGSCHCGAIRIEADAREDLVGLCYCTDCQAFSGSAFQAKVWAPRETMVVTGNPKIYVKVGESGLPRALAFCPDCGTPLYADYAEAQTPFVSLRLGFLEQRDHLVPKIRVFHGSAPKWSSQLEEIPSLERGPSIRSI